MPRRRRRKRRYGLALRTRCPRCRYSVVLNWRRKKSKSPQSLFISEIADRLDFLCPHCSYRVDLGSRPELPTKSPQAGNPPEATS